MSTDADAFSSIPIGRHSSPYSQRWWPYATETTTTTIKSRAEWNFRQLAALYSDPRQASLRVNIHRIHIEMGQACPLSLPSEPSKRIFDIGRTRYYHSPLKIFEFWLFWRNEIFFCNYSLKKEQRGWHIETCAINDLFFIIIIIIIIWLFWLCFSLHAEIENMLLCCKLLRENWSKPHPMPVNLLLNGQLPVQLAS